MKDYLKYINAQATFNSRLWGKLTVESVSFTPASDGDLAVYIGQPLQAERPIVRIHSQCVFAETFDSDFCDCADQLYMAMDCLVQSQKGILVYLRFDGRGEGLSAKVKATALEIEGMDTFESRKAIGVQPEARSFEKIGEFFRSKGITKITLLTNNPDKINDIAKCGIDVKVEKLVVSDQNENVKKLYETKRKKFGHHIE